MPSSASIQSSQAKKFIDRKEIVMPRHPHQANPRIDRIRKLNDELRSTFVGGTIVMSSGVAALAPALRLQLLAKVRSFDAFSTDNDPHGEHDFGTIEIADQTYFFKIDYYDRSLAIHSPDETDPAVTTRVLTIMCADEY
jgi:Protein of unknown function (DUF3768)